MEEGDLPLHDPEYPFPQRTEIFPSLWQCWSDRSKQPIEQLQPLVVCLQHSQLVFVPSPLELAVVISGALVLVAAAHTALMHYASGYPRPWLRRAEGSF